MRAKVGRRRRMKYRPGHAERRPLLPLPPPRHRDAPTCRRERLRTEQQLMAAATVAAEGGGWTARLRAKPAARAWLALLNSPLLLPPPPPRLPGVKLPRGTQIGGPLRPAHPQRRPASPAPPSCPAAPAGAPARSTAVGPPLSPPSARPRVAATPPPLPQRYHSQYSTTAATAAGVTGCALPTAAWLVSSPSIKPSSRPCCGTVTPPCRWPLRTRKKRTTGATAAAAAAGAGAPPPHRRARPTAGCCLHQLGGRPPPRCQTNGEREGDQLSHALAKTRPTVRGWG